tara:strand:- start:7085 stop:7882 length:798 start_codon:yes stop_codon:yes gene_type:complete
VQFQKKTVLITGASSGIGRACAHAFAREGAHLILTARSSDGLRTVVEEVGEAQCTLIPADLTDSRSLLTFVNRVTTEVSKIDIVVNNAGVGLYAPLLAAKYETVRTMITLNFLAPVELTRRLLPLIPRGGAVVNISSIAGKVPLPWFTLYSASKSAINAFSDGLRMELDRFGIHVLCVCPGYVNTSFRDNSLGYEIPDQVATRKHFVVTSEQCAEATIEGLRLAKKTVVVPKIGWILAALTRILPGIVFWYMTKINNSLPSINRR